MHQNLAIILQQLCYNKISFIVLIPECLHARFCGFLTVRNLHYLTLECEGPLNVGI